MKIADVKLFVGGMDSDSEDRLLESGDYREAFHFRTGRTESSNTGAGENIVGNTDTSLLSINSAFTLPSGTNRRIGSVRNEDDGTIIYFIYNSLAKHSIIEFNVLTKKLTYVLKEKSILNFQLDKAYLIHLGRAFVIDGYLYWTDDYNPPRFIDISDAKAKTALNGYSALTAQILDQCAYPPIAPPTCEYADDTDSTATTRDVNLLQGKLFQFRYKWIYEDNRPSVWSLISKTCLPNELQRINGYSIKDQWKDNHIDVTYNTGSEEVKRIDVAFREGNTGNWRLWTRIPKKDTDGNVLLAANQDLTISFYNNIIGEGLEQQDVNRLYDSVPFKAGAMTLVNKNRIVYGDYEVGQDNVDVDVALDVEYDAVSLPVPLTGSTAEQGVLLQWVVSLDITYPSLYPEALWQVQYTVKDITYPDNPPNEIQPVFVWSIYYLAQSGDFINTIRERLMEATEKQFGGRIVTGISGVGLGQYWVSYRNDPPNEGQDIYEVQDIKVIAYDKFPVYKSFKYNATHEFTMIYTEDGNRESAAMDIGNISIPAPFKNNATILYDPADTTASNSFRQTKIAWTIKHDPPSWATKYHFAYKPPQGTFVYGMASDFYLDEDKVRFSVNSFFGDFNEANNKSIIPNYIWEKGDRIRFIAVKPGNFTADGHPANPTNQIKFLNDTWGAGLAQADYEIQGEYYAESTGTTTTSGDTDPYQKYVVDQTYVKDEHGNKVYKPSAQQIYVTGLDLYKYNIWQARFDLNSANEDLGSDEVLVEIYKPSKEVTEEGGTYFEIGDVYDIVNGQHSVISGYFDCGDVYIKLRTWLQEGFMFPVEDKNVSDYYESNYHDIGRVNTVLPEMKRQRYFNQMMNGGTYLPNTMVNNLTKVDAWDYAQVGVQFGKITFMGQQGYTLVVFQESKVTSIYIGKVVLRESKQGGGLVATTENIFGEINPSETIFGCKNPESVVDVNRNFYFYDVGSSKYVLYAANGMHPVSDYKMNTHFRTLTETVLTDFDNTAVFSGWDQKYDEVLITVVTLPNYTPIDTVVFSEIKNRWIDRRKFYSAVQYGWQGCEGLDCLMNTLVAFQEGRVWVFDNALRNNLFGHQWDTEVYLVGNKEPLKVKTWESMVIDSNKNWTAVIDIPANETYGRGMYSRIKNFVNSEGRLWAAFGRNMKTHQTGATVADLINGSLLKGNVIRIRLTNTDTDEAVLFSTTINGQESK